MSATDELRRMLDERGVEWTSERVSNGVLFTFAKDGRTYSVFVRDRAGLEIWSQYLTPEQAIAATLGSCRDSCNCTNGERMYIDPATLDVTGATRARQEDADTCHVMTIGEFNGKGTEYYDYCSNCGYEFDDDPLNYCPNCGRRIEVDDG